MARASEVSGVHPQQQDEVGRKEYVSGGYSIASNGFIWGKVMARRLCLRRRSRKARPSVRLCEYVVCRVPYAVCRVLWAMGRLIDPVVCTKKLRGSDESVRGDKDATNADV